MRSDTAAMASRPASLASQMDTYQHAELAKANVGNAAHGLMPCCPSEHAKSDCSQLCLQKCFGPLAVMPTATRAPAFEARRFVFVAAEPPSDWSAAPQPPPPRT
jgi:hypothetical protein